nr:MAG TPA: hypothetical protein [Caudoviricetes sp.]
MFCHLMSQLTYHPDHRIKLCTSSYYFAFKVCK